MHHQLLRGKTRGLHGFPAVTGCQRVLFKIGSPDVNMRIDPFFILRCFRGVHIACQGCRSQSSRTGDQESPAIALESFAESASGKPVRDRGLAASWSMPSFWTHGGVRPNQPQHGISPGCHQEPRWPQLKISGTSAAIIGDRKTKNRISPTVAL